MHLNHGSIALSLTAALLACPGEQEQSKDTHRTQDPSPSQRVDDAEKTPVQLAQYPGAPHEDRDGNLWFATVLEGLIRYDGSEFVHFTTEDGLGSNMVRGILEDDDGTLWIATGGGLSRYDGDSFKTLTDYADTPVRRSFSEQGDHLELWDVMRDRDGTLWIATMDGVFRYEGNRFVPFPLPVVGSKQSSEFTPKMVYCIFEDKDGVLWFGTDGAGAVSFDGTKMAVYTVKDNGLSSDRVCTILQDARGDFWFGTSDGGVSQWNGEAFTTHMRSSTFSPHSGWGRCMSILEDRAGDIWFGVASTGGGAYRYDGKTFRHYSTKEGLGDGGIPSIREDRSGNLWFGTTAGVYRFDGERFVNFTMAGGSY